MSKMKKKNMKQPTTRLRTVAASLMLLAPLSHGVTTTFSNYPLVGVTESFAPHVALALSVEFPTAGGAYSNTTVFSVADGAHKLSYRGYFDNTKCYKYNHNGSGDTGKFFYPSSKAQTGSDGSVGLCNNGGETEEFSGNLLNFMTMTAIDIFRGAMTGGNRAVGTGVDGAANYQAGDTSTATYLRRAKVLETQNGGSNYYIVDRAVKMQGLTDSEKALMRRLLPTVYTDVMMKSAVEDKSEGGSATLGIRSTQASVAQYADGNVYGRPRKEGYVAVTPTIVTKQQRGTPTTANPAGPLISEETKASQNTGAVAGNFDRFYDGYLRFYNDGFKVQLVRRVNTVYEDGSITNNGGTLTDNRRYVDFGLLPENFLLTNGTVHPGMRGRIRNAGPDNNWYNAQYYAAFRPTTSVSGWDNKWSEAFNVVVKVCDTDAASKGVNVEANCVSYGSNYKPEGLMQSYTREKGMRFATFGYLNKAGLDGGVLRSPMKKLLGDTDYGNEWDENTGIFALNPDKSSERNSGSINYLNKFGDFNGYRSQDPAAELYYTALSYLSGSHVGGAAYKQAIDNALAEPQASTYKDNFPAITTWDDPYKRGVNPLNYQCHNSSIILIGDTNTHQEGDVPSGWSTGGNAPTDAKLPNEDNQRTRDYLTALLKAEGNPFGVNENIGYNQAPAAMAALAYWARVNDIRPDIEGIQNGNNFIVDVLEGGDYKTRNGMRNSYYLAAKYGGFTRQNQENDTVADSTKKELPSYDRASWTDDGAGTSVNEFANGVPRNYAVANNPDNMVKALEKAMLLGGAVNNPSQAATGLSVNVGEILDFTGGKKPITLQSTYNFAGLSGDVVAYETSLKERQAGEKVGLELFDTQEIWRASTALAQYHNTTNYGARKVFTTVPGQSQAIAFNSSNAAKMFSGMSNDKAIELTNYILGDKSKEGGQGLRTRTNLLGTVINSTVQPITPVGGNLAACNYRDLNKARNRGMFYAAASNNGMLHIFELKTIADGNDEKGKPKYRYEGGEAMAYMAGTALSKLPEFADPQYSHKYLNDGTPSVTEMCINNEARSVLLGTTGRGGQAVYALDVTDLSAPSTSNVLWEFTDPDLGYTVSSPVITKSPDGKPLAIVSSGYNNSSDRGYMFILDISKPSTDAWREGSNFWKIRLGSAGVGAPFVYDGDQDGVADKIFVGDLAGNMYHLNRTGETGVLWEPAYGKNGENAIPLFTPTTARPFTGAPYAEMINGKLMLVAATGRYFAESDLDSKQQNYAYGFIVDEVRGVVQSNSLLEQTVVENVTSKTGLADSNVSVYTITDKEIKPEHHGWRLTLLQGQNVAKDALVRKRQVAEFTAVRMKDTISLTCQRSGSTSFISVDVKNGGLSKKPIFDTNRDGKHNGDDTSVAIYEMEGMTTSQSTILNVRLEDGSTHTVMRAADGNVTGDADVNRLDSEAGVRRISWREIF